MFTGGEIQRARLCQTGTRTEASACCWAAVVALAWVVRVVLQDQHVALVLEA